MMTGWGYCESKQRFQFNILKTWIKTHIVFVAAIAGRIKFIFDNLESFNLRSLRVTSCRGEWRALRSGKRWLALQNGNRGDCFCAFHLHNFLWSWLNFDERLLDSRKTRIAFGFEVGSLCLHVFQLYLELIYISLVDGGLRSIKLHHNAIPRLISKFQWLAGERRVKTVEVFFDKFWKLIRFLCRPNFATFPRVFLKRIC